MADPTFLETLADVVDTASRATGGGGYSPWGSETPIRHAAAPWYSWMRPPSASRRRTSRGLTPWGTRTRSGSPPKWSLVEHRRHDSIAAMLASLLYLVLRRLLTLVAPNHRSDHAAQIEILVLRHQLGVLRRQVKRPVYRRRDRALLAAASRILPEEHWGAFLVRPETLGIRASATSIAMLLRRSSVGPAPRRGLTWRQFLKTQASGILACDFFTVETAFLKTLYVLFFIEIGTRRVHVTVSTTNPDSSFVTQQARNLVMSLAEAGTQIGSLIRDRDAKFSRSFDDVFVSEGIRVIRTPIRAPNANAFAERLDRRFAQSAWTGCGSSAPGISIASFGSMCSTTTGDARIEAWSFGYPRVSIPSKRADGVSAIERRDLLGGLVHEYTRHDRVFVPDGSNGVGVATVGRAPRPPDLDRSG